MKHETRVNLIFLAVFLLVSLPGAVILFRKKLDPSAARMDQPDVVVRQLPYMTPLPAPPGMQWIVPPVTQHWLDDLCRSKTGSAVISAASDAPGWAPMISSDHQVQLVSFVKKGNQDRYGLVIWSSQPVASLEGVRIHRAVAGQNESGHMLDIEPVTLPPDVRHELVSLGFSHPPQQIAWIDAEFPVNPTRAGRMITIECARPIDPLNSSFWMANDLAATEPVSP